MVCGRKEIFCLLFTLGSGDGWMLTLVKTGTTELRPQPGSGMTASCQTDSEQDVVIACVPFMSVCLRVYQRLSGEQS